MVTDGCCFSLVLLKLSVEKEETLNWMGNGNLKPPSLIVWGYNDPTTTLDQGLALFDLVASG